MQSKAGLKEKKKEDIQRIFRSMGRNQNGVMSLVGYHRDQY